MKAAATPGVGGSFVSGWCVRRMLRVVGCCCWFLSWKGISTEKRSLNLKQKTWHLWKLMRKPQAKTRDTKKHWLLIWLSTESGLIGMKMQHFETLNIWSETQNKKVGFNEVRKSTHEVHWQGIVAALLDPWYLWVKLSWKIFLNVCHANNPFHTHYATPSSA